MSDFYNTYENSKKISFLTFFDMHLRKLLNGNTISVIWSSMYIYLYFFCNFQRYVFMSTDRYLTSYRLSPKKEPISLLQCIFKIKCWLGWSSKSSFKIFLSRSLIPFLFLKEQLWQNCRKNRISLTQPQSVRKRKRNQICRKS